MLDPKPLASSKDQDGLSSANSAEETCRLVEHNEGEANETTRPYSQYDTVCSPPNRLW